MPNYKSIIYLRKTHLVNIKYIMSNTLSYSILNLNRIQIKVTPNLNIYYTNTLSIQK